KHTASIRLICATNRDLKKMVAEGAFRQDLYYRLNVGHIRVPPLRERKEAILPLARKFLLELHDKKKTSFMNISPGAAAILEEYHWPGNVREIQSIIERLTLLWDDEDLQEHHLDFLYQDNCFLESPAGIQGGQLSLEDIPLPEDGLELDKWTLNIVKKALDKHMWKKTETAKYLGITRGVLYTYLKHLEPK
ncbi:MAG: sigma 54-interacting transcriptional regulator, partial [Gemmatimonadota bacterium]|nr:sigma 54-interacting transcriptional regulator [Gemmatimonadota bacterium]